MGIKSAGALRGIRPIDTNLDRLIRIKPQRKVRNILGSCLNLLKVNNVIDQMTVKINKDRSYAGSHDNK